MDLEHWRAVADDIATSIDDGVLVEPEGLTGYSGAALMGSLQRVARRQAAEGRGDYVEVGVFQGLTLLSVAAVLDGTAYGIDNFAQFDPDGTNAGLVEERRQRNGLDNAVVVNRDYEDALEDWRSWLGDGRIGTYFVDGPHDYRSQLMCLLLAEPMLSDHAVVFVDDSNYRHVRLANRDFLVARPDWTLLFEGYTQAHPKNVDEATQAVMREGFWNGVNVLVHDPERLLPRELPPVPRSRLMAENEHVVQAARFGAIAPEALMVIDAALSGQPTDPYLQHLQGRLAQTSPQMLGRFPAMNTFSDGLTSGRLNAGVL